MAAVPAAAGSADCLLLWSRAPHLGMSSNRSGQEPDAHRWRSNTVPRRTLHARALLGSCGTCETCTPKDMYHRYGCMYCIRPLQQEATA